MNIEFSNAPEVKEVAQDLIKKHHNHLIEAKIAYVFRFGPWKVKKQTRLGAAYKCTGKERFISRQNTEYGEGFDFVILINQQYWFALDDQQKIALVDHELLHCCKGDEDEDGNPTWNTRGHTFEGFPEEVRRNGLWSADLKLFQQAIQDNKQLTLYDYTDEKRKERIAG